MCLVVVWWWLDVGFVFLMVFLGLFFKLCHLVINSVIKDNR